jgi:ATP-binding cassette subfamily B protein
MLPQEGHLFSGTIADNVRLADPRLRTKRCCRRSIRSAHASASRRCRTGSTPTCRRAGVRLSAGERQLVGIARVALADPAVIVLDEATSSLDPAPEGAVERALAAVVEGGR